MCMSHEISQEISDVIDKGVCVVGQNPPYVFVAVRKDVESDRFFVYTTLDLKEAQIWGDELQARRKQ